MKTIEIKGYKETIIERSDYPPDKIKDILNDEVTGILGYGPQGRGQGLNMRDQGFNVLLGLRKGRSWDKALEDGWEPGKNLFEMEEVCRKATIIQYLLSDAGQIAAWPMVKSCLNAGDALYFSHGFGIVFREQTNIVPPPNVDVMLVAPKGSGLSVRRLFEAGTGINASFAVHQDYTGRAKERCLATAFAIGSGHVFETTFEHEVTSDLTGERCVLMGLIEGAFRAQFKVLRAHGHSPSEAFNETVEEALQSLYPLINENGMDWMYANCSTTAQRGALDWAPRFEEALTPIIEECYDRVRSGKESQIAIDSNSQEDYREKLDRELKAVDESELWTAGRALRPLRPGG
ncbi:MAG: ketol-acid reductoisomerase [SAR324 cluster bacterium]|nr:ketol-acid reductoisomerase [SAR324 cluster bacterium]MCZ6554429.1 ketol-acid reductoisomerase [SAR324 cluster bacterium]